MGRVVLGADNLIEKSLDMVANLVGTLVMVMEMVANLVGTLAVVTVMVAIVAVLGVLEIVLVILLVTEMVRATEKTMAFFNKDEMVDIFEIATTVGVIKDMTQIMIIGTTMVMMGMILIRTMGHQTTFQSDNAQASQGVVREVAPIVGVVLLE